MTVLKRKLFRFISETLTYFNINLQKIKNRNMKHRSMVIRNLNKITF